MKKNGRKLQIKVESLRLLDGPSVFGAATDPTVCQTSCQPTCGIQPATTNQAARANAFLNSARVCCV